MLMTVTVARSMKVVLVWGGWGGLVLKRPLMDEAGGRTGGGGGGTFG